GARTNLSWHGAGGLTEVKLVTKKMHISAVPVSWGDVISKISLPIVIEGESGETFCALYEGLAKGKTAKLIVQSESKAEAPKTETLYTGTLKESVLINTVNAPFGYIYAAFCTT